MKWIIPFSFLMIFETLGNFVAGLFGSLQNLLLVPLVLIVYAIANYFWLQALKDGSGLARGTIYFGVAVVITTAVVGFAFYEETLSILKLSGIGLVIVSLFLMADFKRSKYYSL